MPKPSRSREKKLQREIKNHLLTHCYIDRLAAELISKTNSLDIMAAISEPDITVPQIEHGEVLADSRGRGTMQGESF